jgi:TRAP-type C4-dicarboxylate transport system permease small subunit
VVSDPGAAGGAATGAAGDTPGRLERLCELVCEVVLVAMVALIGAEALARSIAHVALESADEFGGYLLVALSFLSLSTCQVTGAFHHLELVQARLSSRGRAISRLIFDLLSFAFSAVLLWQLVRLTWNTWSHGEVAQTEWITPLWMPMLTMPLGVAALCATLVKILIADLRLLSASARER